MNCSHTDRRSHIGNLGHWFLWGWEGWASHSPNPSCSYILLQGCWSMKWRGLHYLDTDLGVRQRLRGKKRLWEKQKEVQKWNETPSNMDSWLLHMWRFPTSTDTKMKGRKKIQRMNSSLAKELSQPTGRSICLFKFCMESSALLSEVPTTI